MELALFGDEFAVDEPPVGVEPADEVGAKRWVDAEIETLTALQRDLSTSGDGETAAVLAHVVKEHVESRQLWREAIDIHRSAAEHWRESGADLPELHAQLALATAELQVSRYPSAEHAAKRALDLARAADDRRGTATALGRLGELRWHQDDLHGALRLLGKALDILRELGDASAVARAVGNLGMVQSQLGDPRSAIDSLHEALSFFRGIDEHSTALKITNNIGGLYLEIGDNSAARQAFEEVLSKGRGLIGEMDLAISQSNLASLFEIPKETDRAVALASSAINIFRRSGALRHQAIAMNVMGRILLDSGNPDSALELHSEAYRIARSVGAPREEADALSGLDQAQRLLPNRQHGTGTVQYSPPTPDGFDDRPRGETATERTLDRYRELLRPESRATPDGS